MVSKSRCILRYLQPVNITFIFYLTTIHHPETTSTTFTPHFCEIDYPDYSQPLSVLNFWNEERENFTLIRLVLDSRSNSALPKFRAKGTTFSPTVLPCSNHDRSEHPSTTQLPPHVCQPQFGFWQILQLPERHCLGKICIIWPASLLNSGLAVSKYPNSWGKIESEKPKQRT